MIEEFTKEYEGSDTLVHEVDLGLMPQPTIAELKQEGNYLVGVTDTGVKFRQRIPANKVLTKVKGNYALRDIAM